MNDECLVFETSPNPPVTVVLLHGYAMQPEDLAPFVHSLGVPGRFVLPRAATAADPSGRAWWSVDSQVRASAIENGGRDLAFSTPEGREPVRRRLADLLIAELALVRSRPCVLAGFSQGGMLACDTLLHEDVRVNALALLSSSCIDFGVWHARRARLSGLKTLVAHGVHDTDLALAAGERLRDLFVDAGANVQWLAFDGAHQMTLPVWRELRKLIRFVSSNPADGPTSA